MAKFKINKAAIKARAAAATRAAKAKGKDIIKRIPEPAMEVGLITLGALGTAKFADFKTLFPNADPNGFFIRHQGLVKAGGAILLIAAMPKMPVWLKLLVIGIGVEGAVREARVLTESSGFFVQIGANNARSNGTQDQAMLDAAKTVTEEYRSSVAGDNPLIRNSQSGVAALTTSNMPTYRSK